MKPHTLGALLYARSNSRTVESFLGESEAVDQPSEGDRSFLSPLVGNTPFNRPISDFLTIKGAYTHPGTKSLSYISPEGTLIRKEVSTTVPSTTFEERTLYNQGKNISTPNTTTSAKPDLCKAGNYVPDTCFAIYDPTAGKQLVGDVYTALNLPYEDFQAAQYKVYLGNDPRLILLQERLLVPKVRIIPWEHTFYPDSRDFYYTLSFLIEYKDFLSLLRVYDLYRTAGTSPISENSYLPLYRRSGLWGWEKVSDGRAYTMLVREDSWQDFHELTEVLFERMLVGWTLGLRQLASLAAFSLTDLQLLEAAYIRLKNAKQNILDEIDGSTTVTIIFPDGNSKSRVFSLSSTERSRLKAIVEKVFSYVEIQKVNLAARIAQMSDRDAPYNPIENPESVDPKFNVNIVYDKEASEQAGVPIFRDISVNKNLQFSLKNVPIVDQRIPLVSWQKAPEIMSQLEQTYITPEGFALPEYKRPLSAQRGSLVPLVIGGLAIAAAYSQMK